MTEHLEAEARARVLGLASLRNYPALKQHLAAWLAARAGPWAELADICFRVAGGCDHELLTRILSSWLILFSVSGPLDDYADDDKSAGAWETLGRRAGSFVALAMIAEAFELILGDSAGAGGYPQPVLGQAASVLASYLRAAALGQAWDIAGIRTLAEYEQMLELKAASLVAALTESIAVAAEAEAALRRDLAQCGRAIGMAIQIVNDYLGVWRPEALAKTGGGDLAQRQLAYPVLYALQVDHPHADGFRKLWAARPEERNTTRMREILNEIGTPVFMRAAIEVRRAEALRVLGPWAQPGDIDCLDEWCNRHMLGGAGE